MRSNEWANRVTGLRNVFAQQLPCPCFRCGEVVEKTDAWDLDHQLQVDKGGNLFDINNLAISHAGCNRADGARITNEKRSNKVQRVRKWK